MRTTIAAGAGTACLLLAVGCAGLTADVHSGGKPKGGHRGPAVSMEPTGPARSAAPLYEAFDPEAAMETVRFIDRYYRAPANEGYDAVLDHLHELLSEEGFGSVEGLTLDVLEEDMDAPAWTPRSASLVLTAGDRSETLHAFERPEDVDRVMLPIHAPTCSVEGPVVFDIDQLESGGILVTDAPARQVLRRAMQNGAAAVVSAALQTFNTDPSGRDRHLDAILITSLRPGTRLPVAQISRRSLDKIRAAYEAGEAPRLAFEARVDLERRPLRTLVAKVIGRGRPLEAVAVASHVQEPGACDNASGAAGLAEAARAYARLLRSGELEWPARTVVFLWGDEFDQTRAWLEHTERRPVAGFSSDMTGESHAETGAIALLERGPDPGALLPLEPDEHTPWGAGEVSKDDLNPNALAVVARCAMIDVAELAGGWISADHPWEGGSDHDEFIDIGVPAVLFWHFTDFAYHTSLDRLDMVDPHEIHRTQVALVSSVVAVANPKAEDLSRYRDSIRMELDLRVAAAEAEGRADIAQAWRDWCKGAEAWLEREMTP